MRCRDHDPCRSVQTCLLQLGNDLPELLVDLFKGLLKHAIYSVTCLTRIICLSLKQKCRTSLCSVQTHKRDPKESRDELWLAIDPSQKGAYAFLIPKPRGLDQALRVRRRRRHEDIVQSVARGTAQQIGISRTIGSPGSSSSTRMHHVEDAVYLRQRVRENFCAVMLGIARQNGSRQVQIQFRANRGAPETTGRERTVEAVA